MKVDILLVLFVLVMLVLTVCVYLGIFVELGVLVVLVVLRMSVEVGVFDLGFLVDPIELGHVMYVMKANVASVCD